MCCCRCIILGHLLSRDQNASAPPRQEKSSSSRGKDDKSKSSRAGKDGEKGREAEKVRAAHTSMG